MNILLTIHETIGLNTGAAGSTLQLGETYKQLGHEVSYFSIDNLPKAFQRLPFYLRKLVFPEFLTAYLLRKGAQSFDVIDASTGDAWLWATVSSAFSQLRKPLPLLVTRSHGLEHIYHLQYLAEAQRAVYRPSWRYRLYRGGLQLWEVARSLKSADQIFVLNQHEKDYISQQIGIPLANIHRVKNGMPPQFMQRPFEPTPTAPNEPLRIAQVGTYEPRKGVHYSVPALNRLLAQYPYLEVSFLGTACSLCPDAERVYADFDPAVRDRVTVIPQYSHEQLPELLRGHHIKLFPTLCEGFGKALIEGMACGLAPVTTYSPGPADVVRHGIDGLMMPVRDEEAIERALAELIGDRALLNELRENAYAAAQQYSWESAARQRLSLYSQGLNNRTIKSARLSVSHL